MRVTRTIVLLEWGSWADLHFFARIVYDRARVLNISGLGGWRAYFELDWGARMPAVRTTGGSCQPERRAGSRRASGRAGVLERRRGAAAPACRIVVDGDRRGRRLRCQEEANTCQSVGRI